MSIWLKPSTLEELNNSMRGTMCEHLGMIVTEIGDDYLTATIPVDTRTQQHMGIIHGGASVVLAETIGGMGASLCCKPGYHIVGLDINANHLRAGKPPFLTGVGRPLHIGGTTMVWEMKIFDLEQKLVCISRLTLAVLKTRD